MHELSIACSLVEEAAREASRAGAGSVTKLRCRIGELRQIDSMFLAEAFEIASSGTVCDRAELCVEKSPVRALCPQCHRRFAVRNWVWKCPACGSEGTEPVGGDELELLSLEAEVHDEDRSDTKSVCQK